MKQAARCFLEQVQTWRLPSAAAIAEAKPFLNRYANPAGGGSPRDDGCRSKLAQLEERSHRQFPPLTRVFGNRTSFRTRNDRTETQ
jgi:hypothetical protein